MSSGAAGEVGVAVKGQMAGLGQMDGRRLAADQERTLLRSVRQDGSMHDRHQALATLWQAYSGLVAAVASRYRRAGIDIEDLIGAGQLGLHAAIVRFDAERFPGRLSTYAVPWIRWYVQDHISRNALPVRLPATIAHRQLARSGGQLFAEARRACHREQVEPTEMELCARVGSRVGLSADEVARSRRAGSSVAVELDEDTPIDSGDAGTPEDDAIQRLDREKLRRRILTLADTILGQREREVFLARCMTGEGPISRLDELGARFGVSRERIYQLESSARRKMITVLRQEGFADLPDQQAPADQAALEGEADVRPAPLAVGQFRSR
ncbi:MAG TPA: sigma-70 family RNA polymerase sigma factor [Acetobacteraceae bacterium]|jgi:RNA polymerase sigma factor (sigma-70 family)|nr:sigma-70 family RNA polymerase sigma factor [Acetobacteraceae bacterium]